MRKNHPTPAHTCTNSWQHSWFPKAIPSVVSSHGYRQEIKAASQSFPASCPPHDEYQTNTIDSGKRWTHMIFFCVKIHLTWHSCFQCRFLKPDLANSCTDRIEDTVFCGEWVPTMNCLSPKPLQSQVVHTDFLAGISFLLPTKEFSSNILFDFYVCERITSTIWILASLTQRYWGQSKTLQSFPPCLTFQGLVLIN